jgi:hypothetical protein
MNKLALADIDIIDDFYKKSGSELAYNSFTGTYAIALGHKENIYYDIINDDVCFYITIDTKTNTKSIIPLYLGEDPAYGTTLLKEYCTINNINSGTYVDKKYVKYLENFLKLKPAEEAEHEALYPIERYREFKDIDNQKRSANIFFKNNKYKLLTYTDSYKSIVNKISEDWEENSLHPTDSCDSIITIFFTEHHKTLPLLGFVLLVNGKPAAYLFGEKINNSTFVIYIIKADRKIKGIYQAFQNLVFSHNDLTEIRFINGTNLTKIKGLRESKLNLKPLRLITPWATQ